MEDIYTNIYCYCTIHKYNLLCVINDETLTYFKISNPKFEFFVRIILKNNEFTITVEHIEGYLFFDILHPLSINSEFYKIADKCNKLIYCINN